ncbi:MAG: galactose-1-phosphate uridylyltransferase [Actinobacteria bacterium]|nr:galactose-1-phosphate uridylyltransferase [Actinomycetota bacterium]
MSERRRDPLSGEWRTFAVHRQDRTFLPPADLCPLCPTLDPARPTEIAESSFEIVVFDNRFPALVGDPSEPPTATTALYQTEPALGAAEVVVYTDRHDATLAGLGADRIRELVEVWADRYRILGARDGIRYVFVFENKGEAVGVTLHHPHGQIYAYPEIPPRVLAHLHEAQRHLKSNGTCVVCDVVARELSDQVRLVAENGSFLSFVPFAPRFPYELRVVPRRHATSLLDLTEPERDDLAELLGQVLPGYDALFGFSLPYVMSLHQAPTDDVQWLPVSHMQFEFTPLHRTASKLKYMAGSELGAGAFINDTYPEQTAGALRAAVASASGTAGADPGMARGETAETRSPPS